MAVLEVSAANVSASDRVSRFFVLGSFALIPIAAAIMMVGGAAMLLVQSHTLPPFVLAFGATLYGAGYLSFIVGMATAIIAAPKVAEAPVLVP